MEKSIILDFIYGKIDKLGSFYTGLSIILALEMHTNVYTTLQCLSGYTKCKRPATVLNNIKIYFFNIFQINEFKILLKIIYYIIYKPSYIESINLQKYLNIIVSNNKTKM